MSAPQSPKPAVELRLQLADALDHSAVHRGLGMRDEYGHDDYRGMRGNDVLASALARWFRNLKGYPIERCFETHYDTVRWLPKLLVEAFEDIRTLDAYADTRAKYLDAMEGRHGIADLIDIRDRDRSSVAHEMARLFPLLLQPLVPTWDMKWLKGEMESYFEAQWTVVDHAWKKFVRKCLRPNFAAITDGGPRSGKFSGVEVLTFGSAGRTMMTFRRSGPDEDDEQLSYVIDDGDPYSFRAGPNWPTADYLQCVEMLEAVVTRWDYLDRKEEGGGIGRLKESKKVWFG
jgi:hypothetical protein